MEITKAGVYLARGNHGTKFVVFISGASPFLKVNSVSTVDGYQYSGQALSGSDISVNNGPESIKLTIEREIC